MSEGGSTERASLVDVDFDPRFLYERLTRRSIVVTVILGALVFFVLIAGLELLEVGVALVATGLAAVGALIFLLRRARLRFAASLSALGETLDRGAQLSTALRQSPTWGFDGAVEVISDWLLRGRRCGLAVRVCGERDAAEARPISSAFEPTKLDSDDAGFRELVAAADEERAEREGELFVAPRRWLPSDRMGRVLVDIFLVAFCVVMMMNAGGMPPKVVGGGVLAVWALVRVLPGLVSEEQWVLVPGGIVVRAAQGIGKTWRSQFFTRADAVLIVWRREGRGGKPWKGLVRSSVGKATMTLNSEEAEFLLRAWLSEVETPSLERLGDLA